MTPVQGAAMEGLKDRLKASNTVGFQAIATEPQDYAKLALIG